MDDAPFRCEQERPFLGVAVFADREHAGDPREGDDVPQPVADFLSLAVSIRELQQNQARRVVALRREGVRNAAEAGFEALAERLHVGNRTVGVEVRREQRPLERVAAEPREVVVVPPFCAEQPHSGHLVEGQLRRDQHHVMCEAEEQARIDERGIGRPYGVRERSCLRAQRAGLP